MKFVSQSRSAMSNVGAGGSEVFTWTANHNMDTFNLISSGSQTSSRINLPNGSSNAIGFENNAGTANLEIYANTSDQLVSTADIQITQVDSEAALILYDDQTTPADNTLIGEIDFNSDSDGAGAVSGLQYGSIRVLTRDVTDATSSGEMRFFVRDDDVATIYMSLDGELEDINMNFDLGMA